MIVNEIFTSIDGEGKRAGQLTTFVRLAGCNLRCSYCDTKYCQQQKGGLLDVEAIIAACKIADVKNVTVTGGEPLIHEDIIPLLEGLADDGFYVNVETNGTVDIDGLVDRDEYPNIFFTVDYKCPSSGMEDKMNVAMFSPGSNSLTENDVLKFVVGSEKDLRKAECIMKHGDLKAQFYLSPVFGEIEASDIVEYMKSHDLQNCKIQLQLHKYIWDPMKRGV